MKLAPAVIYLVYSLNATTGATSFAFTDCIDPLPIRLRQAAARCICMT
jgi:hypothetical protein